MFPKKPLIQRAVHKSLKRIKSVDFPLTTNFKKSEKSIKSIEKEQSDNFSSGAQIGNPSLEYANKVWLLIKCPKFRNSKYLFFQWK